MSATASPIETLSPEGRALRTTTRNIRRTVLPNGMLVLTERMGHVNSLSMGVWVNSGSRDETAERNGISHFVEHMVFKGTTSRSAQQIAREVDSMGGNLDAFTSKENVCFNIKVLEEKADPALDVLSDLVLHPTFAAEDVTREQGVILEEIKMDEDNPDYLVNEIFSQKFWKGDPLGRPILGTAKTVSSFNQEILFHEHARRFAAQTMVFSAAGDLEHDAFVEQIERRFGSLTAHPDPLIPGHTPPAAQPHITLKRKRSLEQVQICLGVPAPPINDPRRYGLYLMNTILGGGMSSRLFQTIREDRGLAYSIYSEMSPFRDTGSLCVYAGASIEKSREVVQLTVQELQRLTSEEVPEAELARAKDQLRSNIVMGLESSGSRMANLARQQMYYGRFFGVNEIVADIDRVTTQEIQSLAQDLFQPEKFALTMLGNLGTLKIDRADLLA